MARSFTGGNNVQIAPNDAFNCKGDGMTLAFWLRTTQANGNTGILSNWNGSSRGGFGVLLNNSAGQVAFAVNGGVAPGGNVNTAGAAVNDGNWHHFAVTFDRTGATNNCRVFKDGAFSAQGTIGASWAQGGQTLIIGSAADGFWARYSGDLAEFGLWTGKLTDEQIAAMAAGAPASYMRPDALEAYLPFLTAPGGAPLDFGRNRFSVTNSGGTVATTAHPRVRTGLFSPFGHLYTEARPPLFEVIKAADLTYRLAGTRAGRASRGEMNLGMFASGRYTQSNYVPPPPDWQKKIIIVM